MAISVECGSCGKALKVKDELAGKKIRCPGCKTAVNIPASEDESFGDLDEFSQAAAPPPPPPPRAVKKKAAKPKPEASGEPSRLRQGLVSFFVILFIVLGVVGRAIKVWNRAQGNNANAPANGR